MNEIRQTQTKMNKLVKKEFTGFPVTIGSNLLLIRNVNVLILWVFFVAVQVTIFLIKLFLVEFCFIYKL